MKFLLIFMAFLCLSCEKSNVLTMSLTPPQRGTVMDPSRIYFLNEYYLIENLTVRLVELDTKVGYKLMLASSINQINETEYVVQIKETYFSNGEIVSVQDVRDSLLRAKENKNSLVPFGDIVESIKSEDNKLILKLKKRVNDFLYFLTLADLSVLHKTQIEKKEIKVEDWEKVSSGPFYYSIQGKDTFLIQNPHYKLSSKTYPHKIKVVSGKDRDTFSDFKDGLIDLGEFNLNSYEKHLAALNDARSLHVIGNNGDMINYFALNADHSKFKSEYNRRWIQKKVLLNFLLNPKYSNVARKAFQFFTPAVKGFVDEGKIIDEVKSWDHIDLNKVPEELKDGLTISTYERAFEVTLEGALNTLEEVLGIPVRIKADVPPNQFGKFINKREFESFLGITSMDQVIVGESINLYYFSSFPMFKDINGKIRTLLKQYQHSDPSQAIGIVKEIAMQMLKDSECVPVFYVASPFFYNKDKVDISSLDEMTYFNLWKLRAL